MAFRPLMRARALPAALTLAATLSVLPKHTLHAETSSELPPPTRKPIYDPLPPKRTTTKPAAPSTPPSTSTPSNPSSSPPSSSPQNPSQNPSHPTPTTRLTTQIHRLRLTLHTYSLTLETHLNALLTRALNTETHVATTIASLAPPPASNERVLPSALYVLVASMASSIVVRNRGIIVRGATPVGVGIGAAWYVLPYTMRNVADLVWGWEERVPVVANEHLWARGVLLQGGKEVRGRGEAVGRWAEERVRAGREAVEGWVRKGR